MAKLVILTQGLNGRAHELNVDRTTIGRVEDNLFQIAEASVSSHHCEVHLRGNEVLIRDLNSTNGTFHQRRKNHRKRFKTWPDLAAGQCGIEARDARGSGSTEALRPRFRPRPGQAAGGSHHGHPARCQSERTGKRRTSAGFRHQQGIFQKTQQGRHLLLAGCGRHGHCHVVLLLMRVFADCLAQVIRCGQEPRVGQPPYRCKPKCVKFTQMCAGFFGFVPSYHSACRRKLPRHNVCSTLSSDEFHQLVMKSRSSNKRNCGADAGWKCGGYCRRWPFASPD